MFDSLDERIQSTEGTVPTKLDRAIRILVIAGISVILFGGLFMGVWLLEY